MSPLIEKITFLQLFGTGIALLGAAFTGNPLSIVAIFCGLLLSFPHVLNVIIFKKYYEGLNLNGFLAAVVLPALAGIEILFKTKTELKAQNPQLWEISLVTLGLLSFIHGSVAAYLSTRYRSIVQHLSLAWIGLLLFVLNLEGGGLEHLALYMISVFVVCASTLTSKMIYIRHRLRILSNLMWVGLPGFVGFVAIYSIEKLSMAFNPITAILIILCVGIHATTLLRPKLVDEGEEELTSMWYVVVNGALQIATGIAFFWIGMGGLK